MNLPTASRGYLVDIFLQKVVTLDASVGELAIDEAKKILFQEIEDYYTFFKGNPDALLLNPIFGKLNKTELEIFHDKHFRHDFEQFGIAY